MKKKIWFYIITHSITIACSILFFYLMQKPNQNINGVKIGILDMQRVKDESLPFKELSSTISTAHEKAQERISHLENELRQEYEVLQNLQKQSSVNAADLRKRNQELDQRVAILEQEMQKERDALSQQIEKSSVKLESKIKEIVNDYTKKEKINLLLNTKVQEHDIALVADSCFDHTNAIIKLVNDIQNTN